MVRIPSNADIGEKESRKRDTKGTAGFFLSVFNLMNVILGSGILGLSYAMAQLGVIMFVVICAVVAIVALSSVILMLKICDQTGAKVTLNRRSQLVLLSATFHHLCRPISPS